MGLVLTTSCQAPPRFTVALGGDVLLARNPGRLVALEGPRALLKGLAPLWSKADLRIVNLESVLSLGPADPPVGPKLPVLVLIAAPTTVQALKAGRVDLVSMANNHILDGGPRGVTDTLDTLDEAGIGHAGAARPGGDPTEPAVLTSRGREVVFLAFTRDFADLGGDRTSVAVDRQGSLVAAVRRARAAYPGALILVSVHWGREGTAEPDSGQRALARACVDAGADVLFGHHAHLVQSVEQIGRSVVFYSLGNLVFDGPDGPGRTSALALVTWEGSGPPEVRLVPLTLEGPAGVPVRTEGAMDKTIPLR